MENPHMTPDQVMKLLKRKSPFMKLPEFNREPTSIVISIRPDGSFSIRPRNEEGAVHEYPRQKAKETARRKRHSLEYRALMHRLDGLIGGTD